MDEFGYELDWGPVEIKKRAYRLQLIKKEYLPDKIRKIICSYLAGKMRFAAGLYWVRGTKEIAGKVRFYYAMALSAILGLSAMETCGPMCCKGEYVA